ncbi:MAG: hypothetical protein AAFU03_04130, partial [Bacteroidota bacterium]
NYLSGQQRIYLNPLRVFFITGVLFITICSNLLSDGLGKEITEWIEVDPLLAREIVLGYSGWDGKVSHSAKKSII